MRLADFPAAKGLILFSGLCLLSQGAIRFALKKPRGRRGELEREIWSQEAGLCCWLFLFVSLGDTASRESLLCWAGKLCPGGKCFTRVGQALSCWQLYLQALDQSSGSMYESGIQEGVQGAGAMK